MTALNVGTTPVSRLTPEDAPRLSVLLTSWNTVDATRRCLASLAEVAGDLTYEVVAVDNGSVDGSAELLAADPTVTLIRNETNLGFAAAVNQARRSARSELLLLLNSDVTFHPGALTAMIEFLDEHPEASGASPRYLNPDGTFQQHYVQLPSFAACIALWTVLKRAPGFRGALERFQMVGEDFSERRELSSASCLLIRASAVGADTVFDERFPVYWNDALLTRELHAEDHRLWMLPDAVVTHARGASCRLLGPATRFRHLLGGLVNYLRLTESPGRVVVFRAVLTGDYLLKASLGRTTTLGWRDLQAALRGDVGPLPDGDIRDWDVIAGPTEPILPAGSPQLEPASTTAAVVAALGRRRLVIDPPVRGQRRLIARRVDHDTWRAPLPTVIPFGRSLPGVRLVERRWAAAQVRRWLDHQAGERTLHTDRAHRWLQGKLGEDVPNAETTA